MLLAPKGVLAEPNAGVLEADPKADELDAPNAGVLVAPKLGVLEAPNGVVLGDPKTEVLEEPNAPPDPKAGAFDTPKALPVLPNADVVEPKAGVLVAPNAGELVVPKAGLLDEPKLRPVLAPNAGWLDAPKGADDPKTLLPNAGCDG